MSNEPKPPMAFNKSEGIRAKVEQIDWGSNSVFVTYPNPDGGMRIGDFWQFDECEIFPFVRLDKNGDKVYAGDRVRIGPSEDMCGEVRLGGAMIETKSHLVRWDTWAHHGIELIKVPDDELAIELAKKKRLDT